jgi:hypothetical protein
MADNNGADANSPRKPTEKEALFFLTILGAMKNKPEVSLETSFLYTNLYPSHSTLILQSF